MAKDFQDAVRRWVRDNIDRLDWSQAELSRQLGMKDPSIMSNALRGIRRFSAQEIADMENLFGEGFEAPSSSNFSVEILPKSAMTVSLGEIITAGFRDGNAMGLGEQPIEVHALNSNKYQALQQEVWRVEGDCADLYVQSGNFVIAVPYDQEPRDGHKVVVKRYHPLRFQRGDLSHYENSIRLISRGEDGRIILRSLSSNPDIRDIQYDPDDGSVIIHRLIIGHQHQENY
jgi:hypothetical protein